MKKEKIESSESGTWNSAKRFSDVKVMNPLELLDTYETISQLGFATYEEYIKNKDMDKYGINFRKINGFIFLVAELLKLIRNVDFAISKGKENIKVYFKQLVYVQDMIPKIYKKISKNKVCLDESYEVLLSFVLDIKLSLNEPLNKNNLIYMNKEIYDPIEYKKSALDKLANI